MKSPSSNKTRVLLVVAVLVTCPALAAVQSAQRMENRRTSDEANNGNKIGSGGLEGRSGSQVQPNLKGREGAPSDWLGLVGTLAGAVVGGFIGWVAALSAVHKTEQLARKRQEHTETEQSRIVRRMLEVELVQNLEMLRQDMRYTAMETLPQDRSGVEWLAVNPCPKWSTTVWERSVLLVPGALSEHETIAVQRLYACLHSLTVARGSLSNIYLRTESYQQSIEFYRRARQLADEAISIGDPLQTASDASTSS